MQYGVLYKLNKRYLYKTQICVTQTQNSIDKERCSLVYW